MYHSILSKYQLTTIQFWLLNSVFQITTLLILWNISQVLYTNIMVNNLSLFNKLIIEIVKLRYFKMRKKWQVMMILGFRSISVIIESNRSVIGFQSVNLIEFTDISVSVNYRSVSVNSVRFQFFYLPNRFTDYIIKMFYRLSRHPVVVEGWNHYHSNRLDATSRMVVVSSFYHHWMPR